MRSIASYLCFALTWAVLACGCPTGAYSQSFEVTFDPFDGMGGGDWAPGTLQVGSRMSVINTVYAPDFGIEFGEHIDNGGQGRLGECCDGNYFLNAGKAFDGQLHWFVNAVSGMHFPAGSTISVSWNNNTGGPSALKAYADTISTDMATIDNANDGSAFGGLVGEMVHGPEQYPTLELTLTADAKSFTVHQSAIDFMNDSSFITGQIMGDDVAPNVSINVLTYELAVAPDVGLIGDYNDDGVVDAADYTVWRNTLGSTTDLRADGDNSTEVDSADYAVWKSHYGNSAETESFAGVQAAGVPEPGSLQILAVSMMVSMFSLRWRGIH
jgi:hypothetical protein